MLIWKENTIDRTIYLVVFSKKNLAKFRRKLDTGYGCEHAHCHKNNNKFHCNYKLGVAVTNFFNILVTNRM